MHKKQHAKMVSSEKQSSFFFLMLYKLVAYLYFCKWKSPEVSHCLCLCLLFALLIHMDALQTAHRTQDKHLIEMVLFKC